MEEYLAKEENYHGHVVKIYQDPDPMNPRDKGYQDNFGTMVCFHKKYVLGDEGHGINHTDFFSMDGVKGHLIREKDAAAILPLFLYDHSGITISTKPFHCPWDSGQVGFIYASRDDIRNNFGVKRIHQGTIERATKVLQGEVEEYDRYLTGRVYGYRIEDADGNDIDSCWGYYDEPTNIMGECEKIIDNHIKAVDNKHYPKVDVFVTKEFKFRARIRESVVEPSYEVTIGGEEWDKGKGRNHEDAIVDKMNKIVDALLDETKALFEYDSRNGGGGGKS